MTAAIRIDKLGKRYQISHQRKSQHAMLGEIVAHQLRALAQRLRHPLSPNPEVLELEDFWALKDVDLEIAQGEQVGIIGRNGAGKSTLLKVLSRITEPTRGSVEVSGRVASLLEVGTGFHPELTGRENTFLNGALLGMSKATIKARFDEIVAFAEVEKFLDTPVKRYSSGMYVRLAFAIAAHLEPDVLIVDEVLAVGDAAFQRKCLGKMDEVGRQGRTVLFVSHNASAVRALCGRCVLIEAGSVAFDGATNDALEAYRGLTAARSFDASTSVDNPALRRGTGAARFSRIQLQDAQGAARTTFRSGEPARFVLEYVVGREVPELLCVIRLLCARTREPVTSTVHWLRREPAPAGTRGSAVIEIDTGTLRASEFQLYFWLGDRERVSYDTVDDVLPPLFVTRAPDADSAAPGPGYVDVPSRLIENSTP